MTMSPDRDPRVLTDPALKVAPGMLAAFDVATDLAEQRPGVLVRIIDADTLLEPRTLTYRAPRNTVEVFIDPTGVIVIGTGPDSTRPVYYAPIPLPTPDETCERAFESTLGHHMAWAARAVAVWAKAGPASP